MPISMLCRTIECGWRLRHRRRMVVGCASRVDASSSGMDPKSNYPQHSQDPDTKNHSENLLESETGALERVSLNLPTLSNYEFSDTRFRSPCRTRSVINSFAIVVVVNSECLGTVEM